MENASKALLMAGGVLIAIIILSLILYVGTTTTRLAKSQDERVLLEQTEAFNKEYEAYNKKKMYGTDIITVINKAMEYNQSLGASDENYFVDVQLNLEGASFVTTIVTTWEGNGKKTENVEEKAFGLENKEYHLIISKGNKKQIDEEFKNFFKFEKDDSIVTEKPTGSTIKTTQTYSGLASFKRATFRCEGIEYSPITGRVNLIKFKILK